MLNFWELEWEKVNLKLFGAFDFRPYLDRTARPKHSPDTNTCNYNGQRRKIDTSSNVSLREWRKKSFRNINLIYLSQFRREKNTSGRH